MDLKKKGKSHNLYENARVAVVAAAALKTVFVSATAAAVDACGESRLTANDAAADVAAAATLESKRQKNPKESA